MKIFGKLLLLWIFSALMIFLSYFSSSIIEQFVLLESIYTTQIGAYVYYLIGIEVLVLSLFLITKKQRYSYIRTILGVVAGNGAAISFLIFYLGSSIASYIPYGINAAIDLVLILLLITVMNKISSKRQKEEDIEDINEFMGLKKDLESLQNQIYDKKEELSFLETMIKDKELDLSRKKQELTEALKESTLTSHFNNSQDDNIILDPQTRDFFSPVIQYLEQISKEILKQTKTLEEKERYIDEQIKTLQERQREYDEQLYHVLFDSPELGEDEVKLKDKHSEIIIKKGDLNRIRDMVERALEE